MTNGGLETSDHLLEITTCENKDSLLALGGEQGKSFFEPRRHFFGGKPHVVGKSGGIVITAVNSVQEMGKFAVVQVGGYQACLARSSRTGNPDHLFLMTNIEVRDKAFPGHYTPVAWRRYFGHTMHRDFTFRSCDSVLQDSDMVDGYVDFKMIERLLVVYRGRIDKYFLQVLRIILIAV